MADQIVVTAGDGQVSLATRNAAGLWTAEAVRAAGAWPTWRPGHSEAAVSVVEAGRGSVVEVVDLHAGGFRTSASFSLAGEPAAIAPRVPHYALWSPDGTWLSVVSRAEETLGLTCFAAQGGTFGEVVTGAPIFSTWMGDSARIVVHAGPRLLVVEPGTGRVVRTISEGSVGFRAPAVSPSGRIVFAEPRDGALCVMQTTVEGDSSWEVAQFGSGAVLAFRPGSEELTVGLASATESGALSEVWFVAADGKRRRISRGPYVAYSWSPTGEKLALVVPAQTGDGRHAVRVLDEAGNELCASEPFVPSQDFRIWLAFFDQYAQSHSIWDAAGETLLLAGRRVEDGVHASLGDAVGDTVFAWRTARKEAFEVVSPGQTGFFSRAGEASPGGGR